jgi:hypothetical protein
LRGGGLRRWGIRSDPKVTQVERLPLIRQPQEMPVPNPASKFIRFGFDALIYGSNRELCSDRVGWEKRGNEPPRFLNVAESTRLICSEPTNDSALTITRRSHDHFRTS